MQDRPSANNAKKMDKETFSNRSKNFVGLESVIFVSMHMTSRSHC